MNRDSDTVGEDASNFNVQEPGGLTSEAGSTIEGIEATATMAIGETLSGAVVGPYKLLRQIGEGGMGVIYHAQQLQPIHRDVALKVIKPGMDSKQVIARFESERQSLAMMDHPNIARVFDAGTTTAGLPYFVMELVEGIPITRYCDSKRLTLRERIELFIPVCQAIQHAHQKGVIHRDIKPSNILVRQQESQAEPKVIDFGLAKALGPQMSDATMMTNAGMVVGTLQYMSPEQAEMGRHDIDTRSDIYSLGVVLYELSQRDCIKAIAAAYVRCRVAILQSEERDYSGLHLDNTPFLRTRLRSLRKEHAHGEQEGNRNARNGGLGGHRKFSTRSRSLQQGATAAATTLLKMMIDGNAPASVRVRAAECVLSHAKAIELEDIEARLSELERAASESSQAGRR